MSFDLLAIGGTGVAFTLEYLLARRRMSNAQRTLLARILLLDPDETDSLRGLLLEEARSQRVEVVALNLSTETGDKTLEDGLREAGALSPLMQVLLTREDLEVPFRRGMMGRPKVASTILSRPMASGRTRIDTIMDQLRPLQGVEARVIVGSIAGGTGAGMIPFLCRRLRDHTANLQEHDGRVLDLHVLAFLPWFDPDRTTAFPSPEIQRANARGGVLALRTFMRSVAEAPTQGARTWVYLVGPDAEAIKSLRRPERGDVQRRGMVSPVLRDVAVQLHGVLAPRFAGAQNPNALARHGVAVLPAVTRLDPVTTARGYFRGLGLALATVAGWRVEQLVSGGVPRLGGLPEVLARPARASLSSGNEHLLPHMTHHLTKMSEAYLQLSDELSGGTGAAAAVEREHRRDADEARYASSREIADLLDSPAHEPEEAGAVMARLADLARVVEVGTADAEHGQRRYREIAEVIAAALERRLFERADPWQQDDAVVGASLTVPTELRAEPHYRAESHGSLVRFILTEDGVEALLREYAKGAVSFNSSSIASPLALVHAAVDAVERNSTEVTAWCRTLWVAAVRGLLSFTEPTLTDREILRADEAWLSQGLRVVSIGEPSAAGVPIGVTTPQLGFVPAAGVLDRSAASTEALLKALKAWAEGVVPGGVMKPLQEAMRKEKSSVEELRGILGGAEGDASRVQDALAGFVALHKHARDHGPEALDGVALWRARILGAGSGTCNRNGPTLTLSFNACGPRGLHEVHLPALQDDVKEIVDFDGRPWRRPLRMNQHRREIELKLKTAQLSQGVPASEVYDRLEFEEYERHPFPLVPGVCFERTGDDRTPRLFVWVGRGEAAASWNKTERVLTLRGRVGTEHVSVRVVIPATIPVEELERRRVFLAQPGSVGLFDANNKATEVRRWVDVPVARRYLPLVEAVVESPKVNKGLTPLSWRIRFRGGVEETLTIDSVNDSLNKNRMPVALWPNPERVGRSWRYFSVLLGLARRDNEVHGWVMTCDPRGAFVEMRALDEGVTAVALGPSAENLRFLYVFGPHREYGAFDLPASQGVTLGSKAYVGIDFGTSNTSVAVRSSNAQVDGTPVPPGGPLPLVLSACEVGAPPDAIWFDARPWLASTRQRAPSTRADRGPDFIPTMLIDRPRAGETAGVLATRCQMHPLEDPKVLGGEVHTGFKWKSDPTSVSVRRDHLDLSLLAAVAGPYAEAEVRASYPLALAPAQRKAFLDAVAEVGTSIEARTGVRITGANPTVPVDETTVMLYGLLNAFQDRPYDARKLHLGVAVDIGGGTIDLLVAPLASASHGSKDWSQFFVLAAGSVRFGADLLAQDLAAKCGYQPDELQVMIRKGLAAKFHTEQPSGALEDVDAFVADVSSFADTIQVSSPKNGWKTVGGQFPGALKHYYFRDVSEYVARVVAGSLLDAECFKHRAENALRTEARWPGTPADPEFPADSSTPVVVHFLLSGNGWGWLGDVRKAQWVNEVHRRVGELLTRNAGTVRSFAQWGSSQPTYAAVGKAAVASFLVTGRELKGLRAPKEPLSCVSEGIFGIPPEGLVTLPWYRQVGPGATPAAREAPDLPENFNAGEDLGRWIKGDWVQALGAVRSAQGEARSLTGARASSLHLLYEKVLYKEYSPRWIST